MSGPTHVPDYRCPDRNRRVILARRPEGIPQPEDFALDEVAVPEAGPGEFLVRNLYLSADPAQRGWASAESNYAKPVPLGGPMRALAVGVVVRSQAPDVREGEFLYGWFDWQDYAVATPAAIFRRASEAVPLSAHAGLLGLNGLTAYLGLTVLGRPMAGDAVLVSTAGGAVGSLVGQIARNLGCRALGLAGDDAKVARCRERYGYDAVYNYRTADWTAALAADAPGGINVYFDNVGGPILDAALRRMAVAGRVVQCGTASVASWTETPTGPRNEREVLTRRLVWSGFVVLDHVAQFEAAARALVSWYQEGRLYYDEDVSQGIEQAPGAIRALYRGENRGKKLIYVG
ncbi:Putative NADP-dependent oxidoreductase YfmJ [Methylobacterium crusticola]|uniref:NADP-dependent oxidoreductase YfmJ n=1 Tax=Methylobacterium crusticola TaxID=1697972 RepID=A0ABQ4QWX9_9HYPH|nr:NADP-dependent oxidoreductase [Methylobacterium crusticola]GJD49868.1 Putative NADP-dependent oxidoreductase YfmJ [Methylobacterium crusticola]